MGMFFTPLVLGIRQAVLVSLKHGRGRGPEGTPFAFCLLVYYIFIYGRISNHRDHLVSDLGGAVSVRRYSWNPWGQDRTESRRCWSAARSRSGGTGQDDELQGLHLELAVHDRRHDRPDSDPVGKRTRRKIWEDRKTSQR